jgi:hypothetical protein
MGSLRRSHDAMYELVEALRTKHEPETMDILQLLRQGVNIDKILQKIRDGDLLHQRRLSL